MDPEESDKHKPSQRSEAGTPTLCGGWIPRVIPLCPQFAAIPSPCWMTILVVCWASMIVPMRDGEQCRST